MWPWTGIQVATVFSKPGQLSDSRAAPYWHDLKLHIKEKRQFMNYESFLVKRRREFLVRQCGEDKWLWLWDWRTICVFWCLWLAMEEWFKAYDILDNFSICISYFLWQTKQKPVSCHHMTWELKPTMSLTIWDFELEWPCPWSQVL